MKPLSSPLPSRSAAMPGQAIDFARPPRSAKEIAALQQVTNQCIGHHLRAMYAALVVEPIPDQLIALLRKLDRSGGSPDAHDE